MNALPGNDESAAAADAPLDAHRFGRRPRWWPGGAGVADADVVGGGKGAGQAAQQDAVGGDDLHDTAVDPDGDALSGELVADGVLPAGERDQAGGVDEPVNLDRAAGFAGLDGWRPGRVAVLGQQLRSCAMMSRDGTVLSRTPLWIKCTTVVSAQSVTGLPARSGRSQNC